MSSSSMRPLRVSVLCTRTDNLSTMIDIVWSTLKSNDNMRESVEDFQYGNSEFTARAIIEYVHVSFSWHIGCYRSTWRSRGWDDDDMRDNEFSQWDTSTSKTFPANIVRCSFMTHITTTHFHFHFSTRNVNNSIQCQVDSAEEISNFDDVSLNTALRHFGSRR